MACYGLERWIKIEVRASTCHDYAVCSNSWQFRLWIPSLLTAHSALRRSRSQLHHISHRSQEFNLIRLQLF
jgi:hypothetical protein